jgi:hypothetical protein
VVKNLWDINEPLPLKRRGVACTAYHHLGDRGIFSSTCPCWQSAPWECLWGQEMASGVERGRGGGSHGGEGRGGVGVKSRLHLVPSFVASSLSSFLCLCPFPVLQSPRFQGTFQKSVLEMPAFFPWAMFVDRFGSLVFCQRDRLKFF